MLMMMKVKDVLMLMEARQVAVMMMLMLDVLMQVTVLLEVKEFVVKVKEVFLSSLSSTSFPRTRPAARVWASGAKGSGSSVCGPCSRQALCWTLFLKHGPCLS